MSLTHYAKQYKPKTVFSLHIHNKYNSSFYIFLLQLEGSSRWQKAHPYLGVVVTAFCVINVSKITRYFVVVSVRMDSGA